MNTRKRKDLTGERFGHLVVISRCEEDYECMCHGKIVKEPKWLCKCNCGNSKVVINHNLTNGHCTSCGCMNTNKFKDITGKKFGKLTVLKRAEDYISPKGDKEVQWLCKCDCGKETVARGSQLRSGHTRSCGCLIAEVATKHGGRNTKLYSRWQNEKNRIFNTKHKSYKDYGGRGITMDPEWVNDFGSYKKYMESIGYNEATVTSSDTIDRYDNNKGYEPGNIRIVGTKDQANNRRSNVILTDSKGESHTIAEWADILSDTGMTYSMLHARYKNKNFDTVDKMLYTPPYDNTQKIELGGKSYTISELSKIYNLNQDLIYDRIFRGGWDPKRALETPVINNERIIEHGGNSSNISGWGRALNIPEYTIRRSLNKGLSLTDIIQKNINKNRPINAIYFVDKSTNSPISQQEWEI